LGTEEEKRMIADRVVKVTVTVAVLSPDGQTELKITKTRTEGCGNPLFTTRVAHRLTEGLADTQRVMLGAEYGELDKKWRET
jgi:hypothetical protein